MLRISMAMLIATLSGAVIPPTQEMPSRTAARAQIPTEVFAELPMLSRPAISPDGKRIAAKMAINGQQYFAIVTVGELKPKLIRLGETDLNWWKWVNDEWLVAGIGQEASVEGTTLYLSRAIGVPVGVQKITMLAAAARGGQDGDDVIWTARDGSARVMISYQRSVYMGEDFWPQVDEVDLGTGKGRRVLSGRSGIYKWYADGAGTVRIGIGISDDGRSSRLLYRNAADAAFRVVDRARRGEGRLTVPAMFLRDSSKALTIDDDEGGYSALYELDLVSLERGKQLFATPGYDIGGLVPAPDGFGYLGVAVEEDRPQIRWIDPEMAAMQAKVAALVKGGQVDILSVSRDRSRALVRVGGADSPGAWFIYETAANEMITLAQDNSTIGLKRMHPVKTIRYKARDGLEIAAVLTMPRDKSGKLPLIVMPHGGPFARDSETWDWWTQFLADRGYAVIQPNYRGSSGYGTPFTKKGEGQWGLSMQDDLNDAITTLNAQGIVDPARVCIVGGSYGGYAAMRAAQRDGTKYRCAVSFAGVSDLNRMVGYQRNYLHSGATTDWLREQAPDLKSVSPINFPEQFSIPLLLVHGDKDRVVPPVHSKVMAQKLKAAGKPVTYIVQKEGDHHFSRQQDRLEFLKALEAFLNEHNPA